MIQVNIQMTGCRGPGDPEATSCSLCETGVHNSPWQRGLGILGPVVKALLCKFHHGGSAAGLL